MGAISEEIIDTVREKVDIVELIGEFVRLERRGREWVGLCPFHEEKTPSFTVSQDKQMFYCFGCGAGGNIYSFLMKKDHLSFPEAVTVLASRAGIEINDAAPSQAVRTRERYLEINRLAADFFSAQLKDKVRGRPAREYLARRGISPAIGERFGLGYAPAGWGLIASLGGRGYGLAEIEAAGLIMKRTGGSYRELFRHRLMFPITGRRGEILGFGGRVLGPGEPKYINTPETPVFHKGKVVYGLHQSLAGIRQRGYVLVVEGYMDVITAHLHGIEWAVASLGTALTPEQARIVRGMAEEVVIAYDGDKAGQAAAWRGLRVLQQAGCRVRVARLPAGLDPDNYLNKMGGASFRELVEQQSLPLIDYKLQVMLETPRSSIPEKLAVIDELAPDLAALPHAGERLEYSRRIAQILGVSEPAVLATVNQVQDKKVKKRYNKTGTFLEALPAYKRAQAELLSWMVHDRHICEQVLAELSIEDWEEARAQEIAKVLMGVLAEGQPGVQWDPAALLERVQDANQESAAWLANVIWTTKTGCTPENVAAAIKSLKLFRLHKQMKKKLSEIRDAEARGEAAVIANLLQEVVSLRRALEQLR